MSHILRLFFSAEHFQHSTGNKEAPGNIKGAQENGKESLHRWLLISGAAGRRPSLVRRIAPPRIDIAGPSDGRRRHCLKKAPAQELSRARRSPTMAHP